MSKFRILSAAVAALTMTVTASASHAALLVFDNLGDFNTAAGSPGIAVDFDSPALNDVTGATLNGVTLTGESGNTLNVVDAASTSTPGYGPEFSLPATSGGRILSPGGAVLTLENGATAQRDGVTFTFASGVSAFGLDVLFQSLDGFSLVGYEVRALNGDVLASNGFIGIPAQNGGGSVFLGFAATDATPLIGSVQFFDNDDNDVNPDSNLGYDTLRFATGAGGVPEPASWALMITGFGFAGAALRRRTRTALA